MSFKGAATVVVATSFEVLYADGVPAADFSAPAVTPIVGATFDGGLIFHHTDTPGVSDSGIVWTRDQPNGPESVYMVGPGVGATNETLSYVSFQSLDSTDTTTISCLAQRNILVFTGLRAVATPAVAVCRIDGVDQLLLVADGANGTIELFPMLSTKLNGRTARMMINQGSLALAANFVTTVAVTQVTGSATVIAMNAGDIMFMQGTIDFIQNAVAAVTVIGFTVNGVYIPGVAVCNFAVVGERAGISIVSTFTAPSTGNFTLALATNNGAGNVIAGGIGTTNYTYQIYSTK